MLHFFANADEAVRDAEVLWIAYDTPVDDDEIGHDYVSPRSTERSPISRPGATVLISSQCRGLGQR